MNGRRLPRRLAVPLSLALLLGCGREAHEAVTSLPSLASRAAAKQTEPTKPTEPTEPTDPGEPGGPAGVELVFLANEGFLLRGQHDVVLLDAFVEKPLGAYGALPPETHAALVKAAAPFDAVDLVLVSHDHPDHHQLDTARAFLAASPATLLPGTPQVTALLRPLDADVDDPRFPSVLPAPGESETATFGNITVEFLRLRHGGLTWEQTHNLGHLITIDGVSFLHLGDVDVEASLFEPFELASRDIDVIFVPYWFFFSTEGRAIVAEHLRGRWLVPVHVPPAEVSEVADYLALREDVVVFGEALDSRVYRREE